MIPRAFLLLPSLLLSAPLAAQVGHLPTESPYEDLRGKQALTFAIGQLATGKDPAGVGPRPGVFASTRWELHLTGPLWLQTRVSYAPRLERVIKDPLLTGAARNVGLSHRPLTLMEAGFGMNLTGNKSWHRVAPQLHGAFGLVSGGTGLFDVGGYRFGNKFMMSYGGGARLVTHAAWEVHVDLTHAFWRYRYPESYGGDGSATDVSILGRRPLRPWQGNFQFSLGASRFFFR